MADERGFLGKQLGSYRLVAEIDSGFYGSVYKGQHLIFEDEPIVAIKVLYARLDSSEERDQFIHEARLLKKLKHPFILPILDASIQDGVAYVVTEYASRGSLRDRIKQQPNRPFPLEEALTLLSQIGQALHHAHQHYIVHRDLKPANVLFNGRGEALLADFGIAAVLEKAGTTQLGQHGTPAYMAPEQFEGFVSTKSDQYALGCIAYELVTGRKPFTVENVLMEAIWYQHAKVDPMPPTQFNPLLPSHIEQAILKAMAKERTDRHADVSAFLAALQKSVQQWLTEGNTLADLKQYEEALAAYEHAIGLNPNLAIAYNNKGSVLNKLKRYEEAVAASELAIRLDPNDMAAYHTKGIALFSLKRYKEALAVCEHAIRLNPQDANAYFNKGSTLNKLKRYEEALTAYEHAIHLDSNLAIAYNNKGNTLYSLKRYEEALTAYEHAIYLNPRYANAYQSKGITLTKLGRSKEAQRAYAKARQLGYSSS
jgi:serine/threonine protein kinase